MRTPRDCLSREIPGVILFLEALLWPTFFPRQPFLIWTAPLPTPCMSGTTFQRSWYAGLAAIPAPDLSHTLRAMSSPQAIDYLIRNYHLPASSQQLMEAMEDLADREYRDRVPLKQGVRPLLERLHQLGVPCAVATASQVHQARQALERLGVWSFFSFALSATQYGPKTRPDLYLEAARQLGAAPQHTLVFEDALHAAQTAVQAGFQVVGRV